MTRTTSQRAAGNTQAAVTKVESSSGIRAGDRLVLTISNQIVDGDKVPVSAEEKPAFKEKGMSRNDVTEKIVAAKVRLGMKWADVAAKVGLSKEWVTAACLGQMTLSAQQAAVIGEIFGLDEQERRCRSGANRDVGQIPAVQDLLKAA
jgi:hypothetical protein